MELYFIRHGQSTNNAIWAQTGSETGRSEDPELTDLGWEQARRVARFVGSNGAAGQGQSPFDAKNKTGFGITHLYCSPMVSAVDTGNCIAEVLGLPLHIWQDIHEVGGIFLDGPEPDQRTGLPGKTRSYYTAHYPSLILPDDLDDQGWWNRPFEERADRPTRAARVLRVLMERHGDTEDHVAIVSHGGFYMYLMGAILDLQRRDAYGFVMNNVAITRIRFTQDRTWILYMNRTDFLPPEMIT